MSADLIAQLTALAEKPSTQYTQSQLVDAHLAAVNEFTSPAVKTALKGDVAETRRRTFNTTQIFVQIDQFLAEFNSPKHGKLVSLRPDWFKLHELYHVNLWKTIPIATNIAGSTNKFQTTILPLVTSVLENGSSSAESRAELAKVIASVDAYIKESDEHAKAAKSCADLFRTLQTNITNFGKNFDNIEKDADTNIRSKIAQIDQKLGVLRTELLKLDGAMRAVPRALGVGPLANPTLGFFSGMGVGLAGATIKSIKNLGAAINHYQLLQKQMRDLEEEKYKLADYTGGVIRIRGQLSQVAGDHLSNIIQGTEFFELSWNCVNSDCIKIKTYLEDLQKAGSSSRPLPTIMMVYVKNTNTVYAAITAALNDYAKIIRELMETVNMPIPLSMVLDAPIEICKSFSNPIKNMGITRSR